VYKKRGAKWRAVPPKPLHPPGRSAGAVVNHQRWRKSELLSALLAETGHPPQPVERQPGDVGAGVRSSPRPGAAGPSRIANQHGWTRPTEHPSVGNSDYMAQLKLREVAAAPAWCVGGGPPSPSSHCPREGCRRWLPAGAPPAWPCPSEAPRHRRLYLLRPHRRPDNPLVELARELGPRPGGDGPCSVLELEDPNRQAAREGPHRTFYARSRSLRQLITRVRPNTMAWSKRRRERVRQARRPARESAPNGHESATGGQPAAWAAPAARGNPGSTRFFLLAGRHSCASFGGIGWPV